MEGTPSAGPPCAAGRKEQMTDTKASVPRRHLSQALTTPSLTCLWLGERPRSTDPHCPVGPVGTPGQTMDTAGSQEPGSPPEDRGRGTKMFKYRNLQVLQNQNSRGKLLNLIS